MFAVVFSEWEGKCQDKIRNCDCTVYYSGGVRVERSIVIVVHTSIVRNVF